MLKIEKFKKCTYTSTNRPHAQIGQDHTHTLTPCVVYAVSGNKRTHVHQVWDTLFLEGYKIIFRIGLAVLQMYEKQVYALLCVGVYVFSWVYACINAYIVACMSQTHRQTHTHKDIVVVVTRL
jgi:hypothetical protein